MLRFDNLHAIILEAETKVKSKSKIDLGSAYDTKPDQPVAKVSPKKSAKSEPEIVIKSASKGKTDQAMANLKMSYAAAKHLSNLAANSKGIEDEPKVPTTDIVKIKSANVPKHLSSTMVAAGYVDPDFHLVSNLPGMLSSMIQMIGKQLFGSFTSTPISDISVVASLNGSGPNSSKEVNSVAKFAKDGKDLGDGEIDFSAVMPRYVAKVHHYSNAGVHFMLCKDEMGEYIYAWPENTSKAIKAK